MTPILAAGAISLWISACIDGTLHGLPKTLCNEFQVQSFPTVEACSAGHDKAVKDWLDEIKVFKLPMRVTGFRCGPAMTGDDI